MCGNSNKTPVAEQWGQRPYQSARNDWTQNGHDSLLIEGGKYGLGRPDLAANVNWFSKVSIDDAGDMIFAPPLQADAFVDLRFEMIRSCSYIPVHTR